MGFILRLESPLQDTNVLADRERLFGVLGPNNRSLGKGFLVYVGVGLQLDTLVIIVCNGYLLVKRIKNESERSYRQSLKKKHESR